MHDAHAWQGKHHSQCTVQSNHEEVSLCPLALTGGAACPSSVPAGALLGKCGCGFLARSVGLCTCVEVVETRKFRWGQGGLKPRIY